jgi:adenosylcobinamide-GDP ribazoletransferase
VEAHLCNPLAAFDTWRSVREKSFVQRFVSAAKYLTIWGRFIATPPSSGTVGAALVCAPLIGFALGLVVAFSNYALAAYLPTEILSITLIMVLILLTGGLHLEDLYLTFAAKEPPIGSDDYRENGALGAIALVMVLLFKAAALDSIDQKVAVSLVLAPVLARWTSLVFVFGCQERCEETAKLVAQQLKLWHLLLATAATLALASYWLGRRGLWIALALSVSSLLIRNLFYRARGIITSHHFGAMIELAETLSLILLASI